jgi:hypothetical protein
MAGIERLSMQMSNVVNSSDMLAPLLSLERFLIPGAVLL